METVWFGAHLRRVPDEKGFMIGSVAKLRESSVRSKRKTEPNPVRDQSTVMSNSSAEIDGPNSKPEIQEDTIREREEIWIWEYDSVSMGWCSFHLITMSARSVSLWNERKHFRHYNSMRVLIVLPGIGSWLGHRGCWLHSMEDWSVWQVVSVFVMGQDLILFVRGEIYLTRGKLSHFPFNKSNRCRNLLNSFK